MSALAPENPKSDKTEGFNESAGNISQIEELRERLKTELMNLNQKLENKQIVPNTELLDSEAYKKLRQHVEKEKEIKENDELWKELHDEVVKHSRDFEKNLRILTGGKVSSFDLRTIILIKFNLTTREMASVFNRSDTAIFSRRSSLSKRIFGRNLTSHELDNILRLL